MRKENFKRQMILASAVVAAMGVSRVHAATSLFWDADADTSVSTGGPGNWDTTSSLWRPGSATGTPLQTWLNDGTADAFFGGTGGTVTLQTPIAANSVNMTSSNAYTLSSTTNTLTTGTINNSSNATQTFFVDVLGTGAAGATSLTINNTNAATGAAGATITSLQGMLSMSSLTDTPLNPAHLNTLNISGPTGGSYFKYNQVRIWNPQVSPFNAGVFDDGSRNAWSIDTTINITGDYAMLAGNTPDNGVAHAGSHNFQAPVHLNGHVLLVAASVGNTMQFNNVIDGGGDVVVTTNDPTLPGAGQGAVVFGTAMTYTGVTRIMNSINGTGGGGGTSFGILRFAQSNDLPATTRLIFGDTGFTTAGAVNLNGTDQTITSLESVSGINAIGIINNTGANNTLTINGGLTSTYGAPIGNVSATPTQLGIAINFPATNTGSSTFTNGASGYTNGTTVSGGTLISKNTINNGTSSPVGSGSVTVNGTLSTQFGSFGGTGQVPGAVSMGTFTHLLPGGPSNVDTTNKLTLNGGLTLSGTSNVDLEFNGFGNDVINTTSLNLTGVDTGANRVVLNLLDLGAGIHNGTFDLIDYGGGSIAGGGVSDFQLVKPVGSTASFALTDTGSALQVTVTGAAAVITWSGIVSASWKSGGDANFKNAGVQTQFTNGDFVTFDDNNSGSTVVVDAAGVTPATVTLTANGNYTFSGGPISSSVLSKGGSGIMQVNNTQTYSGGVTLSQGTIAVGASGVLSGGAITMASGTTLALTAGSNIATVSSITTSNSTIRADATFSTNRNITFGGTATGNTVDTNGNDATFSGVLSMATPVVLNKAGDGTLLINSATLGTMTGAVNVNQGTLALSLGQKGLTTAGTSTGFITVGSGATLSLLSTEAGYASNATAITLQDTATLHYSGESGILGGNGLAFTSSGGGRDMYLDGADASSRLSTRNFIKNTSAVSSGTTVHLTGAGEVHVASGSVSVANTALEYSGVWQIEPGSTSVLSVGPEFNGNNVETLIGLGFTLTQPAGITRPVTLLGGVLAVGSDARNSAVATSGAAANVSGAYRGPVTLGGGAIASTGRQYATETATGTGDQVIVTSTGSPTSNTPVAARYAADMTLMDGTTSKVLLYDPNTTENYDNAAAVSIAQDTNPAGPRNVRIVSDNPTNLNGVNAGRGDVPSGFFWGTGTTLVVDSGSTSGGILSFERIASHTGGSPVSVGLGDVLQINTGSTVALGGTTDPLADNGGTVWVNVVNNSGGNLHVAAGTKNIGTLSGAGNTTIDAATTLIVNEATSTATGNFTGGGSLTKVNSGVLTAASVRTGDLTVTGGGVKIAPNGTSTGTSHVSTLNLSPSTTLDLTNNKLIVSGGTLGTLSGTTYSGITGQIQTGRNGGAWNGSTGIITSQAPAPTSNLTTLAVASNGDLGKTTFGGQSVGPADILVMYTYAGDANLDGKIDADDYFQIDSNDNKSGAPNSGYAKGDFNYDGKVNGDDYFIIDSNFHAQTTPFPAGAPIDGGDLSGGASLSGVSAVPEPTSATALLVVTALTTLHRRRKSQA